MKGKTLKAIREFLGLTQGELASQMGYANYISIVEKEKGRRSINKRDTLILENILRNTETIPTPSRNLEYFTKEETNS